MKFLISGGGICGLTIAYILQQKGHEVAIFEAAPQIKAVGAGLVLSTNAIKALQYIGIADKVLEKAHFLDSFDIAIANGKRLMQTDSNKLRLRYGAVGNATIHRAALHKSLLALLGDRVQLHTGKRTRQVQQDHDGITLHFEDQTQAKGDYLIACDGINSPIRQQLLPESTPRYAGYTCWRSVIRHEEGQFETKQATETWGNKGRFGVVPLINNQIYWFACINTSTPKNPDMKAYEIADLERNYQNYHYPIPEILKLTKDENLLWNDIEDFKPIPKFAFQRILLAGDAGHATTPNMGQGACQAVEDAAVLAHCLTDSASIEIAFNNFEKKRLPRTTKIVNTSWSLGKVAQMTNPFLTRIRNFALKMTPQSMNERQMDFLFNIDFQLSNE